MGPTELRGNSDTVRRQELAAFLRSRRERLRPDDLGIATHGRRRTPGLRREEVAQVAGIGVTWYTWLEQGRDINVSVQVLAALARTLRFDRYERAHLMALAGLPDVRIPGRCPVVTDKVRMVLAQFDPWPAVINNARHDLLTFNGAYGRLFPELANLPTTEHNLLWLIFTHPSWQASMPDWDTQAPLLVAQFRAAMAEHVADPVWKLLLNRLLGASPEFVALWERHEVLGPETGVRRFAHPDVGPLSLEFTHLWLDQRIGTRMTVYSPADDAARQALAVLDDRLVVHGEVSAVG
jgi:transcriptional regulator with XRE-family HTH domain